MGKTILFSPVGGTDPISQTNCYDGAMLHITRRMKPDRIVLYLSKEIIKIQEQDDRYRYALNNLFKLQNREDVEVEEILRPDLDNVQDFDFFYQEFREIIGDIFKQMDPDDRLLINVSSGTPAMKSGLAVLQTIGEYPAELVQVVTPVGGMNNHIHTDYDIETCWECDEDNKPTAEDRTRIVKCPSLANIQKEQIILKHIKVFDYQAAVTVAETIPEEDRKTYFPLLKLGAARVQLSVDRVKGLSQSAKYNVISIKKEEDALLFEYALLLHLKIERKEFADYIRALTPLIVDLFELVLKEQFNIRVKDYTRLNKKNVLVWKWDKYTSPRTGILAALDSGFVEGFGGGPIQSEHLKVLIDFYNSNSENTDENLGNLVKDLRTVESNIRNLAAHEIVSITDQIIQKKTGYTSKRIYGMIQEIMKYTGIRVPDEAWLSYEQLNSEISQRIGI